MPLEKLSALEVDRASFTGKTQKLADGGGLFLLVIASGRYWHYSYRFQGLRKTLSFGPYPGTSLKQARERHREARAQLADGMDPSYWRQVAKASAAGNTFDVVAREWLELQRRKWTEGHTRTVEQRLANDLLPRIGSRPIADIAPVEVLAALRLVEKRGAIESAHRIRTLASQVFRYGVATGRVESDPTRDLTGALTPVTAKPLPSITDPVELGALLRAIDGYTGNLIVRHALQLAPHVFVRPGELRGAAWAEIDTDAAMWTIPAERMKRRRKHHVPLSRQAVGIFESLRELTGGQTLAFPGMRDDSRPISDMTLNAGLRRIGYASGEVCVHGFRHTASTLLHERRDFDSALIEAQLAHADGNEIRGIYNKAEYLDARRHMLQDWSDYLDGLRAHVPARAPGA